MTKAVGGHACTGYVRAESLLIGYGYNEALHGGQTFASCCVLCEIVAFVACFRSLTLAEIK